MSEVPVPNRPEATLALVAGGLAGSQVGMRAVIFGMAVVMAVGTVLN